MLSPTYKKMVETVTGLTPLVGAKWKDFLKKMKAWRVVGKTPGITLSGRKKLFVDLKEDETVVSSAS